MFNFFGFKFLNSSDDDFIGGGLGGMGYSRKSCRKDNFKLQIYRRSILNQIIIIF
jgi:hypothetical protein